MNDYIDVYKIVSILAIGRIHITLHLKNTHLLKPLKIVYKNSVENTFRQIFLCANRFVIQLFNTVKDLECFHLRNKSLKTKCGSPNS